MGALAGVYTTQARWSSSVSVYRRMDPFGDERRRSFDLMEGCRNIEQASTSRAFSPDGFAKKSRTRKGGKKMVNSSPWPSALAAGAGAVVKLSTDPQSVAARERRHRISDRLKILKSLVPGGSKMDTVSMLEEAINYVKFLKAQIWLHQTALMLPSAPSYAASLPAAAGLLTIADLAGVQRPVPVGLDKEEQMISSPVPLSRGGTGGCDQLQQANYSYDLSANYFPCSSFQGFEGEVSHRACDGDHVNY